MGFKFSSDKDKVSFDIGAREGGAYSYREFVNKHFDISNQLTGNAYVSGVPFLFYGSICSCIGE